MQKPSGRAALSVVTTLVSLSTIGCALNQRLMVARAPYGVSDLVFAVDRKLEIQRCDDKRHVWAELPLMFVAGRPITSMAYRLEERSDADGGFKDVSFPYELRLLTKPAEADKALAVAESRAATARPEPMLQQVQQQMIRRATDAERIVRRADEWRCEIAAGPGPRERVLAFEGNRLLGKHTAALIAPADGFRTGGHYRLTFSLPIGSSPPPAREETARLGIADAPAVQGADDVIGRIDLTMIKNSNVIGVPLGIGLIVAFLIVTSL